MRVLAVSVLMLLIAACGSSYDGRHSSHSRGSGDESGEYKVGAPYRINGVRYVPREDPNYNRTGIASWYGRKFHGRRTANGERFDMYAVSAAHPTLPLPSFVRVTNLQNGRSIVVRINDRGPFARGRIIDLSYRAAQLLGFEQQGTARVRVSAVGSTPAKPTRVAYVPRAKPAPQPIVRSAPRAPVTQTTLAPHPSVEPPTSTAQSEPYMPPQTPLLTPVQTVQQLPVATTNLYVQAGAFSERENAERLRGALSPLGRVWVHTTLVDGEMYHRVRLGPLASVDEADRVLDAVLARGHRQARILVDEWLP